MHVFDLNPVSNLKMLLDKWRNKNKKHWSELPQAISMTYSEFRYIWIHYQLMEDSLLEESNIHVPLKNDIERNRERYKIGSMVVFIED